VIIWTRWGIFAFLFVGLGVGLGFLLKAATGLGRVTEPSVSGIFVGIGFLVAGVALFFFDRFVVRAHLDKPRPLTVTRQLAQPYRHPDGRVQTHEVVPAVDPQTGQQFVVTPRSSLFFIPLRFWPYIITALGLVVLTINLIAFQTR
jgi:hypothetical protein